MLFILQLPLLKNYLCQSLPKKVVLCKSQHLCSHALWLPTGFSHGMHLQKTSSQEKGVRGNIFLAYSLPRYKSSGDSIPLPVVTTPSDQ